MPNINKANRQVCDVDIRVLENMKPYLFFDTANVTTINFSGDDTYAKAKGANRIAFSNPAEGSMTIEAQVMPFKFYAMMSDGTIDTQAAIARKKTIKCTTGGELDLPTGVVAGTVYVFAKDDFGGTEIEGSFSGNKFTATTDSEIVVESEYEVGYVVLKTTGVQKISFNNSKAPQDYHVTMNTLEKSEDGVLTPYILTAYKAKPKKNVELSFSSEGDPVTVTMEFSLLEDKNGDMLDIVELEDDEDK